MGSPGRPPFKPTAAQRRQVEELVSCGMGHTDIARALGIARETLRKYFADELAEGLARRRAEVIALLYKSARKGNVSAQKALDLATARAGAQASFAEDAEPAPRPVKLGKKEQAQLDAATAGEGSEWGDDLKPGIRPN